MVAWDYYNKFDEVNDKYLPAMGEGDTMATQICTAVNKLVYKWYNDGDVFDNQMSCMNGWCNDLSSYANWLYNNVRESQLILEQVDGMYESDYEDLLQELADTLLDEEFLEYYNREKVGTIYKCKGIFRFEEPIDDDEDLYW